MKEGCSNKVEGQRKGSEEKHALCLRDMKQDRMKGQKIVGVEVCEDLRTRSCRTLSTHLGTLALSEMESPGWFLSRK